MTTQIRQDYWIEDLTGCSYRIIIEFLKLLGPDDWWGKLATTTLPQPQSVSQDQNLQQEKVARTDD
jgi:hypothetical protein